jgi:hypothetical protein
MNWLAKTIRAMSPNCKEAIRMQSDALDQPLPPARRIGLRIHLFICKWCRRYGRQIIFLRTVARDYEHDHEPLQTLPADARERIKKNLKIAGN